MRILTKTITSPTLGAQIKSLLAQFPEAKWHQYEACGGDSVREGARLAFGKPVNTVYHFDQADVIVSLDADFLTCGAGTRALRARFCLPPRSQRRTGVETESPVRRRKHADDHGRDGGSSLARALRGY